MAHHRLYPPTLFDSGPFGFSQVVKAGAGETVYCSGQTAWDKDGALIGAGDFAAQLDEALRNVGRALAAAGAATRDVVGIRIYVVDHKPDYLSIIGEAVTGFFGADHLPASTLIGVARLAIPDFLVEIEATAVIPA
ncbi:RidA family protein [Sphingomonas flavalba]|uniref:RidA family protein n=1 Tax=Sphingomonas flavalba TaxID=2559804 RepID=UPI0039E0F65C